MKKVVFSSVGVVVVLFIAASFYANAKHPSTERQCKVMANFAYVAADAQPTMAMRGITWEMYLGHANAGWQNLNSKYELGDPDNSEDNRYLRAGWEAAKNGKSPDTVRKESHDRCRYNWHSWVNIFSSN